MPKSRRCVTEYGIAEAWLHEATDGTQTLAVLLETVDAHESHAGTQPPLRGGDEAAAEVSVMARIPGRLLQLRDKELFEGEAVLWQGRPDAWAGLRWTGATWWVSVPWLAMTALANWMTWIDGATTPLFMVGAAFAAIPILFLVRDLQTLYLITDRRALIVRGVWKDNKATAASMTYGSMGTPKVEIVRGNVGHLYFASGFSKQNEDADHTGRYGFRNIRNVEKVRDLLAGAIARHA